MRIFVRYVLFGFFYIIRQSLVNSWKTYEVLEVEKITVNWKLDNIYIKTAMAILGLIIFLIRLCEPYVLMCLSQDIGNLKNKLCN